MNKKNQNNDNSIGSRDPRLDVVDFLGDTTGITGATQNTIEHNGLKNDQYSNTAYDTTTQTKMSTERARVNTEYATEKDTPDVPVKIPTTNTFDGVTGEAKDLAAMGNDTAADAKDTLTSEAPFTQPENLGQQDVLGGSESAPESEENIDSMGQRMGFNYDENKDGDGYGNDEVNTAKQVDDAEEYIREH